MAVKGANEMDPDTTLHEFLKALRANQLMEAREHLDDLYSWLERGGFAPNVDKVLAHLVEELEHHR